MIKKYELTDETCVHEGRTLRRIKALRNFGEVKAGDLGGWIESEENLSQSGKSWLKSGFAYDKAKIFGDALVMHSELCDSAEAYGSTLIVGSTVSGRARVFGGEIYYATISDYAKVYGQAAILGVNDMAKDTKISGHAEVYDHAVIYHFSEIGDKAKIYGEARVFGVVNGRAEITGNARFMGETSGGKIIGTRYTYA